MTIRRKSPRENSAVTRKERLLFGKQILMNFTTSTQSWEGKRYCKTGSTNQKGSLQNVAISVLHWGNHSSGPSLALFSAIKHRFTVYTCFPLWCFAIVLAKMLFFHNILWPSQPFFPGKSLFSGGMPKYFVTWFFKVHTFSCAFHRLHIFPHF